MDLAITKDTPVHLTGQLNGALPKFEMRMIKRRSIYRIVSFSSFSMAYRGHKKACQDLLFVWRKKPRSYDWNIFWTRWNIEKWSIPFDRASHKVQSINFSKVLMSMALSCAMRHSENMALILGCSWSYLTSASSDVTRALVRMGHADYAFLCNVWGGD